MYDKVDLLSRKYMFLESIKVMSQDKSWNGAGRNVLGMWRLVPDGIRRLRFTLRKLPPRDFDILTQEKTVNELFNRTIDILKKKQYPIRFVGKRLVRTQEFYTQFYEDGVKILNEYVPKREPKNDRTFRG